MTKKRELDVFEKHQLRIARDTLKMHDAAVAFMGGPSKDEAREIIKRLTSKEAGRDNYHGGLPNNIVTIGEEEAGR